MYTHQPDFIATLFARTQYQWFKETHAALKYHYEFSQKEDKISYLPDEITGLVNVTISYLNLNRTPRFVKGFWQGQSTEPDFKIPMTRRTFKNININNPKDIAMLQRYFDGVQHRCIPDLVLGTYDRLQTVSYGYGLSGPTKNQDRTTKNLRLTHGLALNVPGFNGLTPRAPWETLVRMQIQISQAQIK